MEKEQAAWKKSKSNGTRPSRVGRERVAWDESKSRGTRAKSRGTCSVG